MDRYDNMRCKLWAHPCFSQLVAICQYLYFMRPNVHQWFFTIVYLAKFTDDCELKI